MLTVDPDLTEHIYGISWSHGPCHAADTRTLTALCGREVAYLSHRSGMRMGLGINHRGPQWSGVTCSHCMRRAAYRRWAKEWLGADSVRN